MLDLATRSLVLVSPSGCACIDENSWFHPSCVTCQCIRTLSQLFVYRENNHFYAIVRRYCISPMFCCQPVELILTPAQLYWDIMRFTHFLSHFPKGVLQVKKENWAAEISKSLLVWLEQSTRCLFFFGSDSTMVWCRICFLSVRLIEQRQAPQEQQKQKQRKKTRNFRWHHSLSANVFWLQKRNHVVTCRNRNFLCASYAWPF